MGEEAPQLECDLIMKGGVTSGAVYPTAILTLAEKFRFKQIGGASAGAIAAAAAACAEYARQNNNREPSAGFAGLRRLEQEVGEEGFLRRRFQPLTKFEPFFNALWKWLELSRAEATTPRPAVNWRRALAILVRLRAVVRSAFARQYTIGSLAGFVMGLVLSVALIAWSIFLLLKNQSLGLSVLGLLLAVIAASICAAGAVLGGLLGSALRAWKLLGRLASEEEDGSGFGICSGSHGAEAPQLDVRERNLTDWLHARLNELAGRSADSDSPTIEELSRAGIDLRLVASNVSVGQPWTLPLRRGSRSFYFRPEEMARLFPPVVVQQLVEWARAHPPTKLRFRPEDDGRLLRFPLGDELPVIVATRLSLSFPVLLSAVRIYSFRAEAYARSERGGFAQLDEDVEDHWISDGGIASNFPIHLFDAWIPGRPTFGITLYDSPVRRLLNQLEGVVAQPVILPRPRDFDLARPRRVRIEGLRDFLSAILNTAQSFRDVAQSMLPSYRERIAQIFLEPHEGGLNLNMPTETVRAIQEKGRRAGELLLTRYFAETPQGPALSEGFLEHRWVRMLVLFGQLEVELSKIRALGGHGPEWKENVRALFEELLSAQLVASDPWYRRKDAAWSAEARRRIDSLLDFAERWGNGPSMKEMQERLFSRDAPRPEAILRVTPDL